MIKDENKDETKFWLIVFLMTAIIVIIAYYVNFWDVNNFDFKIIGAIVFIEISFVISLIICTFFVMLINLVKAIIKKDEE